MTNKNDMAKAAGLRSFDTALPQDWCYDVLDKTGKYPPDYAIVWSYDTSIFGDPVALDDEARAMLAEYLLVTRFGG